MKELLQNDAAIGGLATLLAFIGYVVYSTKQKFDFMKRSTKAFMDDNLQKARQLEEVQAIVEETRAEVRPNHGSSIKDGVNRTESTLAELRSEMKLGFSQLSGEVTLARTHAEHASDAAKSNAHQLGEMKDAQTAQYTALTNRIDTIERRVDKAK